MKINKILNNRSFKTLLIVVIIALLSNCNQAETASSTAASDSYFTKKGYQNRLTRWFKPYKIDIQQGNIITSEMLNDLKIGMSKDQVKHVLGTSVFTDSFDQDQWIYTFSNATRGKLQKEQVLVLSFKDERLNDIKDNTIVNG